MMETSLNGSEALTKFYQNKFYFSYSGLNKLLYSPAMFYSHYVLNEREDRTDAHLVGGRVLHCLLFEPDTYDDTKKMIQLLLMLMRMLILIRILF